MRRPHANIEGKKEKRKGEEVYLSVRANFLDGSREGNEKVKCYQLARTLRVPSNRFVQCVPYRAP